jgi:hypothetical protein
MILTDLSFTSETIKGERYIVILKEGQRKFLLKAESGLVHEKWIQKLKEME